jgi:hypothetical protein
MKDTGMLAPIDDTYYTDRESELLEEFDQDVQRWRPIIARQYGGELASAILSQAREKFERLIPQIPYIGGDENHLTSSLVKSARCLALYLAMKRHDQACGRSG